MAKRNKKTDNAPKKDGRNKTKPSIAVEHSSELGELNPIDSRDSLELQASHLFDSRLGNIQRQELATRIGQTYGNRHLGRVSSAIRNKEKGTKITDAQDISLMPDLANMPIQLLRSGSVDSAQFNESPQDVIAIRLPYQIGEFETILERINSVVQQFGSSSRTYTNDANFRLMLRSFLQEIGHPSMSGGGPVMTRQRVLRLRIRLLRGAGRRISRIELLRPRSEIEVERTEVVEGRRRPEPRPTPEPTSTTEEPAPTSEQAAPPEQEGILGSIASGAEALGNISSGRWVWDPITSQMAEWEAELDRIGEQGSPTTFGTVLMVPVSILFVVLQSIVGLLDLIARLNPVNLILQGTATSVRAASGQYTREDFTRDALAVGDEALEIITLGLRTAFRHLQEGYEEANLFRITQAVSEIALAALAIFGVFRAIRVRSSGGRMAAAVAEERAAPASPGSPGEPVSPTAPTEPGIPGEPVRPTAPTELAPAEPVRPSAPTDSARPGQPGRRSRAAAGRPRVERVFNTEEVARQVRDSYMRGEARGGWDAAFSQESLQAHWRGIGGRGRAPLAFVDTNGHLIFDANRLGMPQTGLVAEGTARRIGRRPPQPSRPGEPVRATAPTEQAAAAEPVRPTAPTESAATPERVRSGAPTEQAPAEPGRPATSTESTVARGRPRVERVFTTEEVARQVRDSYMSGEARGGWDAAFSQESLQAHWEGVGGQGRPPMAFVDTNGHLVFDARRVGLPQEGMVAEGTARRMGRRPPPPSSIREAITDVNRARQLMDEFEQQGLGINRKPNARVMQNAWEHAGGEGTAPVAYVNIHGGLVVNMEAIGSQ